MKLCKLIMGYVLLLLMLTGCASTESYAPPQTVSDMVAIETARVEEQQVLAAPILQTEYKEEIVVAESKPAPEPVVIEPVVETTPSEYATTEGYINTSVKTTINGTVYKSNGSRVFLNDNLITDVSKFTNPQINSQMANTFFISDLSSKTEGNDTALFIAGLIFKERKVDYDDTSEYYQQMVNVGAPCTVILKHMVKANKTYVLTFQQHAGIFTAKHYDTVNNEANPDGPIGDVLLDFVSPSILPHITKSADGKELYYITGIGYTGDDFHMLDEIQLAKISTTPGTNKFYGLNYHLINYENQFTQYGYHKIDIHMFYMKVQPDGTLFLASIGQPDSVISTGFIFDTDTLKDIRGLWRDRATVMSMVTN